MQALPTDGHTGVVGGVAPAEAVRGLLVEHRVHLPHAGGQIGVPQAGGTENCPLLKIMDIKRNIKKKNTGIIPVGRMKAYE